MNAELFPQSNDVDEVLSPPAAPEPPVPLVTNDLPLELFGVATILLAGRINRPENHKQPCMMPREKQHATEAANIARKLHEYCGGRVAMTESAARLFVAMGNHPQAQHCSSKELIAYAIERVKQLASLVTK